MGKLHRGPGQENIKVHQLPLRPIEKGGAITGEVRTHSVVHRGLGQGSSPSHTPHTHTQRPGLNSINMVEKPTLAKQP